MSRRELVDLSCRWAGETDRAIAIVDEENEEGPPIWLPKSQIEYERDYRRGTVEVTLPEWLAMEKELI